MSSQPSKETRPGTIHPDRRFDLLSSDPQRASRDETGHQVNRAGSAPTTAEEDELVILRIHRAEMAGERFSRWNFIPMDATANR